MRSFDRRTQPSVHGLVGTSVDLLQELKWRGIGPNINRVGFGVHSKALSSGKTRWVIHSVSLSCPSDRLTDQS
jgi:hypothetical protein